jgi:methylisocitrate lyase
MSEKSVLLRGQIQKRRALIIPGCHDALSAKVIERCGFEGVQISEFGIAGGLLGKPDVGLVNTKDVLDLTWNVVEAVDIPVMANAGTGVANAVNAAWVTERLINMGAGGMNIEDQLFPKRCGHRPEKEVISAEEMIGKVYACADVRNRRDADFVISACTDSHASFGLDEAIRRCNLYLDAGADLVSIDALGSRNDIEQAVNAVDGPLSVNVKDGVTGVNAELVPVAELAAMGIAQVSIPLASIMVAHRALTDFFSALKASPTGVLQGETNWLTDYKEFTDFVRLNEYRERQDKYLPNESTQPD